MRRLIKTALWPVLPKPWDSPDMEFHFGLWHGVSALYSDSGRQLGEENTRPFALNHHLKADTIACKYAGSRGGRLINMSALRIAMQNFDAALAITRAVRDHHIRQKGGADAIGLWDLYILARASIALIAYRMRFRRQDARSNTVSDDLTSQFQFISGVFMICRHMMENAHMLITENRPVSAQALYDYADENGIFISFNGMACAGSTKKILEFLEFCNQGSRSHTSEAMPLGEIVSEPDNWYEYALAAIELDCLIEQERLGGSGGNKSAADIYQAVGDYARALMKTSMPEDDEGTSLEAAALMRQNRILDLLGRKNIRKLPAKHIAARLG